MKDGKAFEDPCFKRLESRGALRCQVKREECRVDQFELILIEHLVGSFVNGNREVYHSYYTVTCVCGLTIS